MGFVLNYFIYSFLELQVMGGHIITCYVTSDPKLAVASATYYDFTLVADLEYIKNNAWVTVNNDFWVTSEAIYQWFSRVTKSRVKIIGKSPHEWRKNRYSR